jgi:uncharacterized protein (DUF1778 family)
MSTPPEVPGKRESLDTRIEPEERGRIDRAAKARGKIRTDFILDAERLAAEEALARSDAHRRQPRDLRRVSDPIGPAASAQ